MKPVYVALSACILLTWAFTFSSMAQPCIANTHSVDFNGINAAVRINTLNGLDLSAAMTVEAWVYARTFSASTAGNSIFCKHAWGSSMFGYVLRAGGNGVLSFNIAGAVGGSPVGWQEATSTPGSLTPNSWHHVAGVFDGNMLYCYVDGIPVGSTAFAGTIYPSTGIKARIGALADTNWGLSRYWDGFIDEVRLWNRALSASEIQTQMNDHIDPSTALGLVGYWRLNEGSGLAAADLGTGNNGASLVNAAWASSTGFNNPPPPVPVITYSGGQLHSSSPSGNQWYLNGSLIPNATGPSFTPTTYGNYTVEVTAGNCSSLSLAFSYNTTGLGETGHGWHIGLSDDGQFLNISWHEQVATAVLSVYTIDGRRLLRTRVSSQVTQYPVQTFKAGCYLVVIEDAQTLYHTTLLKP